MVDILRKVRHNGKKYGPGWESGVGLKSIPDDELTLEEATQLLAAKAIDKIPDAKKLKKSPDPAEQEAKNAEAVAKVRGHARGAGEGGE